MVPIFQYFVIILLSRAAATITCNFGFAPNACNLGKRPLAKCEGILRYLDGSCSGDGAAQKDANGLKRLVAKLKTVAPQVTEQHIKVHRPWGSYQSIDNGDRHQVKRIIVKPGHRLSLQKHHHRAEHWIVVRGAARVTINDDVKTVHENEFVYIPMGAVHRLDNPGKILLELIEVQTGSYLGEDDIIRIEDDYRRE